MTGKKKPTSLSCRDVQHLKALMPYAGTHDLVVSFKCNFDCKRDFMLTQCELGIQTVKEFDFGMVCRAHDIVGFFFPFPHLLSHRITKYLCS